MAGFGNHHQTEALPGALPGDQNSPQKCAYGLFAEQLSGSAFTQTRHLNLHSWLYRKIPSVARKDYQLYKKNFSTARLEFQAPNPYRWSSFPEPDTKTDFIDSLFHMAGSTLVNAFVYQCNHSMTNRYFVSYDGEWLFVPWKGEITLATEFGSLDVAPGQIAVIPRGVIYKVKLKDADAAGYLCENAGAPLTLPALGVMGANALANPRHFLYPEAESEEWDEAVTLICKSQHHFWSSVLPASPLNVMAWHGNYAPYCYDLSLFNTINTVSFDHPDPSIFTVLTSESTTSGVANLDFVIFPPRWMVAEHTFRPPYFHRNIMSEFMGLIRGEYDGKKEGFMPGGISIHNRMTPHGPDKETYLTMTKEKQQPVRYENTLAFMFETAEPWLITHQAMTHSARQKDYSECWQNF